MQAYTATEILDRQVEVISWIETTVAQAFLAAFADSLAKQHENESYYQLVGQGVSQTLYYGQSYFVTGEVLDIVQGGVSKLPNEALMSDVTPPSPHGFIQLEVPYTLIDVSGQEFQVWALGWSSAIFQRGSWSDEEGTGFIFSAWTQPYDETFRTPYDLFWIGPWYNNMQTSVARIAADYPDKTPEQIEAAYQHTLDLMKLFMVFFAFVDQRIPAITVTSGKPSRSAQRRAERIQVSIPSEVKIVELRRRNQSSHPGTGERKMFYTHRFRVDGHWRRQWYPSENTHKLIWIDSYIKGHPDDPYYPRDTLFNVRR